MRLTRLIIVAALAILLAGCATRPAEAPILPDIVPFSSNSAGDRLPQGWVPWIIAPNKSRTRYDLVIDPATQRVVLHAIAERAASGLKQRLTPTDPTARPIIDWQWRVVRLIETADNTDRHSDDSPVRLMLFFDGDERSLPARDRMMMEMARTLTGQPMPFATLMYIWENKQPPGTVIPHPLFGQLKMVVAGTGTDRLSQWKQFQRNYVEDYQRAYGQPPGALVGVGILTDSDNTASSIEAFYGDIRLLPAP